MNCVTCKSRNGADVPATTMLAYEGELVRLHHTINRLIAVIIVLAVLMAGMAIGFFVYETQFEEVTTDAVQTISAEQNGDGSNVVNGGDITVEPLAEEQGLSVQWTKELVYREQEQLFRGLGIK